MAEGEKEVNYASVVFKVSNNPPPAANRGEETVYGEVKVQNETRIKNSAGHWRCNHLACCLGILCVLLLGGIIAVCVYLPTLNHKSDSDQFKDNSTLLANNEKLSLENANLTKDIKNLTLQLSNLKEANTVSESKVQNLTDNRAQWSINAYCKHPVKDKCQPCQKGWILTESSCYAYNNPDPSDRITWDAAQSDCRRKSSDLAVAHTAAEKEAIKENSLGINGYWIGLRVVKGRWQWVDGSALTDSSWIAAPADEDAASRALNTTLQSLLQ
ncbi:hypothetical protein PBY51_017157 [Eleginops maclovinus]|uniref:C-type lectin domain-containing protein n=1 Tax=Eleginops maclovinus TaxID=56733 RepID=A0AAN8AGC3_ELEMC|nr:hypothetical protein PBY51_017157 [Eleginops maclovinus]